MVNSVVEERTPKEEEEGEEEKERKEGQWEVRGAERREDRQKADGKRERKEGNETVGEFGSEEERNRSSMPRFCFVVVVVVVVVVAAVCWRFDRRGGIFDIRARTNPPGYRKAATGLSNRKLSEDPRYQLSINGKGTR